MQGHIFSSTWMEFCTIRSQITNHKITFSGRRNVTEPWKLWKTEVLKSGLCSSATSVQMLGLCRHWWDTKSHLTLLFIYLLSAKGQQPQQRSFFFVQCEPSSWTCPIFLFNWQVIVTLLAWGFWFAFPKGAEKKKKKWEGVKMDLFTFFGLVLSKKLSADLTLEAGDWWDSCHLHKSTSHSAFHLPALSQRATDTAKVIFLGSVNHQPGLVQYFCLSGNSL